MVASDVSPWLDPLWSPPGMPGLGPDSESELTWNSPRDLSFALHKAVVYADSIGHQPCLEQILLRFRGRQFEFHPDKLAGMLTARNVPIQLSDDRPGVKALVNLTTKYIARGGSYWPPSSARTPLHDPCIMNGVCKDIFLETDHSDGFLLSERPWMQPFAKIALFDGSAESYYDIARSLNSDTMRKSAVRNRISNGQGLLELLVGCLNYNTDALARSILESIGDDLPGRDSRSKILQDSLTNAIKQRNKTTLSFLANPTVMEWLTWDREIVNENIISNAYECNLLSGELMRHLLRSYVSANKSNYTKKPRPLDRVIFKVIYAQSWDLAVELFDVGCHISFDQTMGSHRYLTGVATDMLESVFRCIRDPADDEERCFLSG